MSTVLELSSETSTVQKLQIHLPDRYEHWRPALRADAEKLQQRLVELAARWPLEIPPERRTEQPAILRKPFDPPPGAPLQLIMASSLLGANFLAETMQLPGDAAVPRTHLSKRLALVPLPRDDRILAGLPEPPRTWRETVRHELVHLLLIRRPGLAAAPKWFHEGLAESLVSLSANAYPNIHQTVLGSTWARILRLRMEGLSPSAGLHQVLEQESAEIRYAAWAALALQLLQKQSGPTPWLSAQASPTLGEFLASLPSDYGQQAVWPRPRGRELDFQAGGKSVLLASLPGEVVVLQAGVWNPTQPLKFKLRVGRTGDAQAGILLRRSQADAPSPSLQAGNAQAGRHPRTDAAAQQMRLRVNTFGATVAALEGAGLANARAFQSRPKPGAVAGWRQFELVWQTADDGPGHLELRSEGYQQSFSRSFQPPFALEFYVLDGACEFRSEDRLLPPKEASALR